MQPLRVGLIGLGAMGLPMALNLIKSGHQVRGFDQKQASLDAFAFQGGIAASSATDAAANADFLVLMVVNGVQAHSALSEDGLLAALAKNAVVVLMATCLPSDVASIAALLSRSGHQLIDAPVSGGVVGAKAATLSIMASGPAEAFDRAAPVLHALGDKVFHVGDHPGQGAMMKAINQLLCGVHLAVAAEALSLAEKVGIEPALALEIMSNSAASSWMLRDRGPRMLEEMPVVTSAVDIFVKDMSIVLAAGAETKSALPFAATAHQLFLAVSGQGKGAQDDSKVIEAYRSLRGS